MASRYPRSTTGKAGRQDGFSLIELMISMVISLAVLSGVVSVIVISKTNFVSERELATLQENARFTLKYLTDEIRQAGFTGCYKSPTAPPIANIVTGSSTSWFLSAPGMQGYEYDAGISTFPTQFKSDVRANTDAIVIRRAITSGLRVSGDSSAGATPTLTLNKAHSFQPGQVLIITTPDCQQTTIFQMSGPTNTSNTATTIQHSITSAISPNNCSLSLTNTNGTMTVACPVGSGMNTSVPPIPAGSNLMELQSNAFFVGTSSTDTTVPALFRDRMQVNGTTTEEEVVQGVENMQILYGYDSDADGIANQYYQANSIATGNWKNVVTVRLTIRMRSVYPIYNANVDYGTFEGITGTDGSDLYMRQVISTTIAVRNL